MEKRKLFGVILMVSSIFILNIIWMFAQMAKYIDKLTGKFIVSTSYMPVLSIISIGAIFIYGLYIFFTKE